MYNSVIMNDYKLELEKNGVLGFVPGGNSMWPTLKNAGQSVVVLKKTERLKPMDVALYIRPQGNYVLHRVMQVTEDGYIMCGDSQYDLEPVKEEQVIGVMHSFFRGKKCIECTDPKYIKQVERWYGRKFIRKVRLKLFFLRVRVINKLKRIFGSKKEK